MHKIGSFLLKSITKTMQQELFCQYSLLLSDFQAKAEKLQIYYQFDFMENSSD